MKKVLSVEDNMFNQKLIDKTLAQLELELFHSPSCQSCREMILKEDFDLFIMDLGLPDGNGLDLIKEIRDIEKFAKTPIVIVTAHATNEIREKGVALGADKFIPKPIKIDDFRSTVRELLKI